MKGRSVSTKESASWEELAASSHYRTAVSVAHELKKGDLREAEAGLRELIHALGRSEKRELKSQLIRLMTHVIKWRQQPQRRSRAWVATIASAREEITDIREDTPSLTESAIREMWTKCFAAAKREAEAQMNRRRALTGLSWAEVFEDPYELER